jgi:hypothetical protein
VVNLTTLQRYEEIPLSDQDEVAERRRVTDDERGREDPKSTLVKRRKT